MVTPSCVDEQYGRELRQRPHRPLEQRSLAEREEAGGVGRPRLAFRDDGQYPAVAKQRGSCPSRVAGCARPDLATAEAEEAAAGRRRREIREPRFGPRAGERELLVDELFLRARPRPHTRILPPWSLL
jgi:hypothetical protein